MAAIKVCDPCAEEKKLTVAGWRVRTARLSLTYHVCAEHRQAWKGKTEDEVFARLRLADIFLNAQIGDGK